MSHPVLPQPYDYQQRAVREPDWTRLPGWADVTQEQWEDVQWQRSHCVKNLKQLRAVMGTLLTDGFYEDLELDQAERATMSMLITPQMVNTIVPDSHDQGTPSTETFTHAFYSDPVRRYMLPVFSDRRTDWPSHPYASRDSLHEHDMWKAEGLTHRYPTKVLAEILSTCPQYCGHCTRMDLVGNSTPQVSKLKLELKPVDRMQAHIEYLRATPSVRDVVVSGGDVGNMPWKNVEAYVDQLLDIPNIMDVRLATKALMGLPQHWYSDDVRAGAERLATKASSRGVGLAVHTHVNHANSVTPLVARASRGLLDAGIRDVRNQGVLMAGINNSVEEMLDLCFALLDGASILPYYFYMPDMIPFAEHWRVTLADAQRLQHGVMGYLPGFATPRVTCDVPFVGKRWVHQVDEYDQTQGISYWSKNYRTGIELDDPDAVRKKHVYYDPVHALPEEGQQWWINEGYPKGHIAAESHAAAAASRAAAAADLAPSHG